MEEFIFKNMGELCRITNPSEDFLDFLLMKNIISDGKHNDIVRSLFSIFFHCINLYFVTLR